MVSLRSGKEVEVSKPTTTAPRIRKPKVQVDAVEEPKESTPKDDLMKTTTAKDDAHEKEVSPSEEPSVPPIEVTKQMAELSIKRPSTPPRSTNPFDSELASDVGYEKTPGRDGPIKQEDFSLEPDIKPFKGPKRQKERKTPEEKEEEYAQFVLDNEGHCFHELHVCFKKGPSGSPTYDKSGFELDFAKVAHWMNPGAYSKPKAIRNMNRAVDSMMEENRQMAQIFFEEGEAPTGPEFDRFVGCWKDRVSKDLRVPWHRVDVEDFREWEGRGFRKARRGEGESRGERERERMTRLLCGASLRK